MKRVTIVEVNDINLYPPVQNLIRVLLNNGYGVNFIGSNVSRLPTDIVENENICIYDVPSLNVGNKIMKWKNRICMHFQVNKYVEECMADADYLWTTSMNAIRTVGRNAFKYKNILQLMELSKHGYSFYYLIKFPLGEYARQSWKTVTVEENRAYIQKVWWNLPRTPYVLPNKPYSIDYGEISDEVQEAITKMKNDKRKIVLYLGGIYPDRNFEDYAKAISKKEGYTLYIVGKAFSQSAKELLDNLQKLYPVEYLGAFDPPQHLALVQYAYIGLLPYKPVMSGGLSELNALYCAPNKIFEYSGYGVPMIGSDVIGLKLPFEKWEIGCCCDDNSEVSIQKALDEVDNRHHEMSSNCIKFFESVDLKNIVKNILEEN